jgi:DNA-binding NarL/FixJ family response regulator
VIADDDAVVRESLSTLLGRAGYQTRAVGTGEEALEAVRDERASLVILEVCLPDQSGYSVCRELKDEYGDDLPIIFTSARRTEPFDRVAGLLVGADEYFTKPLAPDELLLRVGRLIRRTARAAPPISSNLTARELEILRLLAEGLGAKEIARRLVVSPKTVGAHVERIYRKLGVRTRAQAVAVAFRDALVSPHV